MAKPLFQKDSSFPYAKQLTNIERSFDSHREPSWKLAQKINGILNARKKTSETITTARSLLNKIDEANIESGSDFPIRFTLTDYGQFESGKIAYCANAHFYNSTQNCRYEEDESLSLFDPNTSSLSATVEPVGLHFKITLIKKPANIMCSPETFKTYLNL